jgi:hypothetical protein
MSGFFLVPWAGPKKPSPMATIRVDVCFDPSLTGAKLKALFFYQEEANADLQHPGSVISVSFFNLKG